MNNEYDIRVDEIIHHISGRINEVEYIYHEIRHGETRDYRIEVKRGNYERLARTLNKPTLPFDSFTKVLRPFMMGKYASEDISQAFRLLDTDHSGTIDIGELAAFMPVINPDINPHILLHHIQKADQDFDYKLNLKEFTSLVNQGIGRDIALGRL